MVLSPFLISFVTLIYLLLDKGFFIKLFEQLLKLHFHVLLSFFICSLAVIV